METENSSSSSSPAPFTVIWTIENFSDLTYIDLESPLFVAKSIGDTVWFLHIDEYAGFFCKIETKDFSVKKTDGIEFELSFLDAGGHPLISERSSKSTFNLISREEFLSRWSEFLPNNTLTIQCRMWKRSCKIEDTDLCYALTKLNMHRGSFVWAVKEFSALNSTFSEDFNDVPMDQKRIRPLKPLTEKGPFMSLILYLKKNSESDDVYVEFLIEKGRNYAVSCELSVLDANGKVIASNIERGRLYYEWAFFRFTPLISKNKLMAQKNLFLPNDTLFLRCSFEVCTGVISNKIEYFTPNVFSVVDADEEVLDFYVAEKEADDSLQFEEYFTKEED